MSSTLTPFDDKAPEHRIVPGAHGRSTTEYSVQHLLRSLKPARPENNCKYVMARFLSDRDLIGLPVIDALGKPVALVDRTEFIEYFCKPYTMDVFGSRSILSLLAYKDYRCRQPIIVESSCSIDDAAKIIIDAGRHHLITGFLITDESRYLGIAHGHDLLRFVTERNESVLRESEARARTIVDIGFDGVMTHDHGVILDANMRFARLFGYEDPAHLIGQQSFDILFLPETGRLMLERNAAGVNDMPFEFSGLRKDGTAFTGETQSCESIYLGKPARTIAVRDLTERKRAEAANDQLKAQLHESQKMDAIGKLAGGIAHDFNNIIASILGNASLASQDVVGNVSALESLNEVTTAARRGRDLVQQILSFSRRQPVERTPRMLDPVVREAARLLRSTFPARISLNVHCAPDVPAVLADATQIQQVIINLATNAMQALRNAPGRIDVGLDTVTLDAALVDRYPVLHGLFQKHPGPTVRLVVRDTGPGMDAEALSRIFEPFFTTKPVNEGTGLGLSVVHGIVEGHEGVIQVISSPGKGASFTIYFPVSKTRSVAPQPVPERTTATMASGQHILYIDDDEALLFLVKRLLGRRGYRVSTSSNQEQALSALRADPASFNLVVTDYNMPGMSGLDVAYAVRAIRADLPVAVASGFIDEELSSQAAQAGVRELIFKANAAEEFCDVVQRLIDEDVETA